jgi:hypothetical protein
MQQQDLEEKDQAVEELRRHVTPECNQAQLARKIAISPQYLSEILNYHRPPSDIILGFLGLERVVTYRPKKPSVNETKPRARRRS